MSKKAISRRDMLRLSGTVIAGTILAGCAPKATEAPTEAAPPPAATEAPPVAAPPAKKPQGNVVAFHDVKELTEDMIAQFQSENPGITIEFVNREEPARLNAMFAAGLRRT